MFRRPHLVVALGIALAALLLPAMTEPSVHGASPVGGIALAGGLPHGDPAVIGAHPSDQRDTWSDRSPKRFQVLVGVAAAILLCGLAYRRMRRGNAVWRGQGFWWAPQSGRAPPFFIS